MNWMLVAAVSLASGLLGSLGLGGGALLLLCLRLFTDMPQMAAQGLNLLFFWPIAGLSIWLHHRHGLIDWKACVWTVVAGLPCAAVGYLLAAKLDGEVLSKLFGVLLLVIGVHALLHKNSGNG